MNLIAEVVSSEEIKVADKALIMNGINSQYATYVFKYYQNGQKKTRGNIKPDEKDGSFINWMVHQVKDIQLTPDAIRSLGNRINQRLVHEKLNNKYPSAVTRSKVTAILNALRSITESKAKNAELTRLKDEFNKVDIHAAGPDRAIENANASAPNRHQIYGASCWATSGQVMANWYMKEVLKSDARFDQLSFVNPQNIRINTFAKKQLEEQRNNPALTPEQRLYVEEENTIKSYMKAWGGYGNLFQAADVMLANMPNTAVCRSRLALDRSDETKNMPKEEKNKIVKQFFDRISEILDENKCPISLLIPGHYRTIVGIKDGKLQVRDSQHKDDAKIAELTVEDFRNQWDNNSTDSLSLELVYLKKIDGNKELEEKYGYSYDEGGRLSYTAKDEQKNAVTQENMIHNLGIRYESRNDQKKRYIDLFMKDEIYVPKNMNNVQNVKDELAKYEKYCRELKVDAKNTSAEMGDIQTYNAEVLKRRKGSDTMLVNYGIVDVSVTKRLEEERAQREKKRQAEEQKKAETQKKKQEQEKKKAEEKKKKEEEQKQKKERERLKEELKKKSPEEKRENALKNRYKSYTEDQKKLLLDKAKSLKDTLNNVKKKKKSPEPTGFDVLHLEYLEFEDSVRKEKPKRKESIPGWFLNDEELRTIEEMLKRQDTFEMEIKDKESTPKLRNEAVRRMQKNGDFSMYNHIPPVLREYYGRKSLQAFFNGIKDFSMENGSFPALNDAIKKMLKGRTRDPIFRNAINMLISRKVKSKEGEESWKRLVEYDEYMNQQLLIQTLEPVENKDDTAIRIKFVEKSMIKGQDDGTTMLDNNKIKQRHLAKYLFMMQLGRFDMTVTGKDKKKTVSMFDKNVSEAVAHGARVGIVLPPGNKAQQDKMFGRWQGDAENVMFSRFATHDIHRAKVDQNKKIIKQFEEVKLNGKKANKWAYFFKGKKSEKPTSYMNNYGMNLALGGLGRTFNKDDRIDDQGRFGHLYQRVVMGDEGICGGILFGIENSAPKGLNFIKHMAGGYAGVSSIGEKHNSDAVTHKTSAFYSLQDNYGDRYDGRTVNLANLTPEEFDGIMEDFENKYRTLQNEASAIVTSNGGGAERNRAFERRKAAKEELNRLNGILTGRILTAKELFNLLKYLGRSGNEARHLVNKARSTMNAKEESQKYSGDMTIVSDEYKPGAIRIDNILMKGGQQ